MKQQQASPLAIASIAGVGMFLSTLDSGIINIAIPSLLRVFHTSINHVIWTVTLYTLLLSATILLFGRLADRMGRLKIYRLGLIGFAISSLLCGLAPSIIWLIIFRGLQGLSAAMMQATAMALITARLTGHDKAKAMSFFGILLAAGPMMGPPIGGFILSALSWQWIFWLNIPICLLGVYGCKWLSATNESLHSQPIAYLNLALLAASMFAILLTMNVVGRPGHTVLILAIMTLFITLIYLFLEKKSKHSIIDFSLFRQLNFSAPMLCVIAFGGATAVAFILPPLYFEKIRHFPAWQVGMISLAAPLGLIINSKFAAPIAHKIGTLKPMLIGIGLMVMALALFTQIQVHWPVAVIFLLLLLYGLGGGLLQTPTYIHLTEQFPSARQAFIAALIRMVQNLAIAFEAAAVAMLINLDLKQNDQYLIQGIRHSWWLATIVSLVALISLVIMMLKGRNRYANG